MDITINDPDKFVKAILESVCTIVANATDWINGTTRRKIPQLTTDLAVLAGQKLSLANQLKSPLSTDQFEIKLPAAQFDAINKSLADLKTRISEMDPRFGGSHPALVEATNEEIDQQSEHYDLG